MPDYDTTGWTVYEPALCECIDAHISMVMTPGGLKPAITLTLFSHDLNRKLVFFCNAVKASISKDNYSVKPNSNFAKLYRLTIGQKKSLSKSQQLMKHLINEWFECEYVQDKDKNGLPYYKVKKIKPVDPIQNESWLPDGTLLKKRRNRARNNLASSEKGQQSNGKASAQNWQKAGKDLAPLKPEETDEVMPEGSIALHKNISLSGVGTSEHVPLPHMLLSDTLNENGGRERVCEFWPGCDESEDDYFQRVIDESWS